MDQFIQRPIDAVTAGLAGVVLILLVSLIVMGSKLKRLRKAYMQFMGTSGVDNLEQVIIGMKEKITEQEQNLQKLTHSVGTLDQTIKRKKGNVAIRRYNAFAEHGNDLSFSLAIINDQEDGLVLSGIHGREQTFVYGKPVKQGQSEYPLTPEEKEAINLALQPERKA
jgi:hypothetical protein